MLTSYQHRHDRFYVLFKPWRANDGKIRGMSGTNKIVTEIDSILRDIDDRLRDIEEECRILDITETKRESDVQIAHIIVITTADYRFGTRLYGSSAEPDEGTDKKFGTPPKAMKITHPNELGLILDIIQGVPKKMNEK